MTFTDRPSGHGGARPGAGRKPKATDAPPTAIQAADKSFQEIRARHEKVKCEQREFELEIKRGRYVERAAVRDASATCMAMLAQGLRSLPDNLERKFHLAPDIAEAIEQAIDGRLAEIATAMSDFTDA